MIWQAGLSFWRYARLPTGVTVMASTVDSTSKPGQPASSAGLERTGGALRWQSPFDSAITFWLGTSGHPYVHSVYSLTGCPEIPPASVILARRQSRSPVALKVMHVEHDAPSLNLADIRRQGAALGANEVHLHFASGDAVARKTASFDLATRHGGIEVVGK